MFSTCSGNDASANVSDKQDVADGLGKQPGEKTVKKVSFPADNHMVTQYFEPTNPWEHLKPITVDEFVENYLATCEKCNVSPLECVVEQIRELPPASLMGGRCPRLCLSECSVLGARGADSLEAVLRRVQFRRVELHRARLDDEAAEALFDMMEFYESASILNFTGRIDFGIRGWQACSRFIKKSSELRELEAREVCLDDPAIIALDRAIRPHSCQLRSLTLQATAIAGQPLLGLMTSLKMNNSLRELRLGDNGLSEVDAKQLASLLRVNCNIQLLDLSNNRIQDAGTKHLTEALIAQASHTPPSTATSPLSSLTCSISNYDTRGLVFLVLWNNQLTRLSVDYLCEALRTCQSLSVLNVGRNPLGCSALRRLSRGPLASLVSLGLQAAELGASGASAVADLVRARTGLQRLDLRDNNLTGPGLESILAAMKENTTLTQIDLDDVCEAPQPGIDHSNPESERGRLTREIRALCRRNEPTAPELRHRKISLTGHGTNVGSNALLRVVGGEVEGGEEGRGGRLRSPAPSPAGSPVPPTHSRFSVTRVTPDRDPGSSLNRSRTTPSPTSRFRVVQVPEPPKIQLNDNPRRNPSRFSVTRNTDTAYTLKGASDKCAKTDISEKDNKSDKISDIKEINSNKSDIILDTNSGLKDKSSHIIHNEAVEKRGDETLRVSETTLVKTTTEVSDIEKVDVKLEMTVKKERIDVPVIQNDVDVSKKDNVAIKQIEALTQDLGDLIQKMQDLTKISIHRKDDVVLKKNKSESSLDSPDLEVSRYMRRYDSAFRDSSSSLEVSGSSVESLNTAEKVSDIIISKPEIDLDRRKGLSAESSLEDQMNMLNTSVSSNESASPFGSKIHGSLSSLEVSVSSDHEKVMVTSADSGIEYSLRLPENREDGSSNEGTLTHNPRIDPKSSQETLTSPKRASSLLDVPSAKGNDRMRKISWVPPSASAKTEEQKETKLSSHLDKLLSIFQHPSSLFSRSTDDERKVNLPPKKDTMTASFWSWGATTIDKPEDSDSSPETATDSTLSLERVQVSYVDESFSKRLDSKTPSTDTDNTLSEFQSIQCASETSDISQLELNLDDVKSDETLTTDNEVQKLGLSVAGPNGNAPIDLDNPNDLNKTDDNQNTEKTEKSKQEMIRPRTFAAVLKSSGSENSLDRQLSPDSGHPIDKIPSKIIRGIKENISPENTLTASVTNTTALVQELIDQKCVDNVLQETIPNENNEVIDDVKLEDETKDDIISKPIELTDDNDHLDLSVKDTKILDNHGKGYKSEPIEFTDDLDTDNSLDLSVKDTKILDNHGKGYKSEPIELTDDTDHSLDLSVKDSKTKGYLENIDVGSDALALLIYENQSDFEPETEMETVMTQDGATDLAEELRDAEIKEKLIDLSPELVLEASGTSKDYATMIPERAKIKKANSLEDLSQRLREMDSDSTHIKKKNIVFKVPDFSTPKDIPERRHRLRTRSGSSPKSLPEGIFKVSPIGKMEAPKKKKKVSSLGKMARDSLLSLNMSEEEIAEFRRSYKLTSVESLRSLESVSEDANSQSGNSLDSRCKLCRTSQESLMSLDSISEDCRCHEATQSQR